MKFSQPGQRANSALVNLRPSGKSIPATPITVIETNFANELALVDAIKRMESVAEPRELEPTAKSEQ